MTQSNVSAVAVTCRTEYLRRRHLMAAQVAGVCTASGLLALVVLNAVGVDGHTTAGAVAGLLVLSLAAAAVGHLSPRGAVVLAVDSDSVYLGDEVRGIVSRPLAELHSVSLGSMAETTGAAGTVVEDLTITGRRTLTLEFAHSTGDGHEEISRWRIGVVESDPAAIEVIARLRRQVPAHHPPAQHPPAQHPPRTEPLVDTTSTAVPGEPGPARSTTPRVADAGSDEAAERLWEDATRRHDGVLRDYGTYEMAPQMLLQFPAVTDVTLTSVQDFHLALDEATALRTERYPGDRARADAYQQAVNTLRRAWIACETNGRRLGTGYLASEDRDDLRRALKLYDHARSGATPAEQVTYYTKVHDIVTTLTDRGTLHPPEPAIAELAAATRRAIDAGPGQ